MDGVIGESGEKCKAGNIKRSGAMCCRLMLMASERGEEKKINAYNLKGRIDRADHK